MALPRRTTHSFAIGRHGAEPGPRGMSIGTIRAHGRGSRCVTPGSFTISPIRRWRKNQSWRTVNEIALILPA